MATQFELMTKRLKLKWYCHASSSGSSYVLARLGDCQQESGSW